MQQEGEGFALFLSESSMSEQAGRTLSNVANGLVAESFGQQLGEDLAIRVTLRDDLGGEIELRSRQAYDAPRELYIFAIDLVPKDGGAAAVGGALEALARRKAAYLSKCALRFDGA